jgi:4-hydroxy-2-oxoglutarate aldolase
MLIDGIHVPLTAPFHRNGDLFLSKLAANVRRYSLSPVAGLIAFAPAAESGSLSSSERNDCWQAIRDSATPEKVLTAHITQDSVANTVRAAEQAFVCEFETALLAAPGSWPTLQRYGSSDALLGYFLAVADQSPLPVLLASNGVAPSLQLSVELIATLARHPNVIGLVDHDLALGRLRDLRELTSTLQHESTVTTTFRPVPRRMLSAAQAATHLLTTEQLLAGTTATVAPPAPALKTRLRSHGFQIMHAGPAAHMLELLEAGVNGVASMLAASAPQATYEPYAAFTDGDPALSALKARRLEDGDGVLAQLGPAAAKHAADLNGYYGGPPRLPLLGLTSADRARVEAAFRDLRS